MKKPESVSVKAWNIQISKQLLLDSYYLSKLSKLSTKDKILDYSTKRTIQEYMKEYRLFDNEAEDPGYNNNQF